MPADGEGADLRDVHLRQVNLGHVDLSKAYFEATDTVGWFSSCFFSPVRCKFSWSMVIQR
ncbi:pentapeptide repeat-containing protein [Enterobacter ludwigii]|uniref:pentapeptide repeat-containing protein n=1 Tax=Enterobacter ludwigii TaxID=299767 RepID=UPI00397574FA